MTPNIGLGIFAATAAAVVRARTTLVAGDQLYAPEVGNNEDTSDETGRL